MTSFLGILKDAAICFCLALIRYRILLKDIQCCCSACVDWRQVRYFLHASITDIFSHSKSIRRQLLHLDFVTALWRAYDQVGFRPTRKSNFESSTSLKEGCCCPTWMKLAICMLHLSVFSVWSDTKPAVFTKVLHTSMQLHIWDDSKHVIALYLVLLSILCFDGKTSFILLLWPWSGVE